MKLCALLFGSLQSNWLKVPHFHYFLFYFIFYFCLRTLQTRKWKEVDRFVFSDKPWWAFQVLCIICCLHGNFYLYYQSDHCLTSCYQGNSARVLVRYNKRHGMCERADVRALAQTHGATHFPAVSDCAAQGWNRELMRSWKERRKGRRGGIQNRAVVAGIKGEPVSVSSCHWWFNVPHCAPWSPKPSSNSPFRLGSSHWQRDQRRKDLWILILLHKTDEKNQTVLFCPAKK